MSEIKPNLPILKIVEGQELLVTTQTKTIWDYLNKHDCKFLEACYNKKGKQTIRAGNKVGYVGFKELREYVEIMPKISMKIDAAKCHKALTDMLNIAYDIHSYESEPFFGSPNGDAVPQFYRQFVSIIKKLHFKRQSAREPSTGKGQNMKPQSGPLANTFEHRLIATASRIVNRMYELDFLQEFESIGKCHEDD